MGMERGEKRDEIGWIDRMEKKYVREKDKRKRRKRARQQSYKGEKDKEFKLQQVREKEWRK